ncbi:hypothetical protein KIPB_006190 [Kipferlia bialata]|uniref:Uncharacterized protein n=1 Tax=Kipferlia bialata TaxID=797122 RepID=A0A9K3CWN5_9EUKA|nr:hypothetical protein KIPB_006190 [Kipferlia bialata]|eukprot:g6190.t1
MSCGLKCDCFQYYCIFSILYSGNMGNSGVTSSVLPSHVAFAGDLIPRDKGKKRQRLDRLSRMIAGAIDGSIRHFSVCVSDRWTYQEVSLLSAALSRDLAVLRYSPVICFVGKKADDSWFREETLGGGWGSEDSESSALDSDDYPVRVLILGPACRPGDISDADVVIQLLDSRHGRTAIASMAVSSPSRVYRSLSVSDLVQAGPGMSMNRARERERDRDGKRDRSDSRASASGAAALPFNDAPSLLVVFSRRRCLHSYPPHLLSNVVVMFRRPLRYCTVATLSGVLREYAQIKAHSST